MFFLSSQYFLTVVVCFPAVAIENDFILDRESVLIMDSKILGKGDFGSVVAGWRLKPKQNKPQPLQGIKDRRCNADFQSGSEDESMALRISCLAGQEGSVPYSLDMNDSRESCDGEDEGDAGVEGSGDSFMETDESDREEAMRELKKQKPKDWKNWRLQKKVAVKMLRNNIAAKPGEPNDPTPAEINILKTKFNREAGIMQSVYIRKFILIRSIIDSYDVLKAN